MIGEIENERIQFHMPVHSRLPFERYFNERVFGNADGPAPIKHNEAHLLTTFNGQILTLEGLRKEVIQEINALISELMSPPGKRLIQLDDGAGPDAEGTQSFIVLAKYLTSR